MQAPSYRCIITYGVFDVIQGLSSVEIESMRLAVIPGQKTGDRYTVLPASIAYTLSRLKR